MFAARCLGMCCSLLLVAAMPHGCFVTVDPDFDIIIPPDGNQPPEDATTITIRIFNRSTRALDPEIYFSDQNISDPNQLFVAENKYTDFGVGHLGVLQPGGSASLTLDCTQVAVIGTPGGTFAGGDDRNDLGDPAGTGQLRMLTQDRVFFCGDRITFEYRETLTGFTTTFDVEP